MVLPYQLQMSAWTYVFRKKFAVPKSAHFPDTSISHKMDAKLDIGLPTHRLIALKVRQNALLSNGACSKVPRMGKIHVVSVAEMTDQE